MNSKGSMMDVFLVAIMLFTSMIAIIMGVYVLSTVTGTINNNTDINASFNAANATHFLTDAQSIMVGFDNLIVVLWFGSMVASLVSAFLIRTHPAFFVVAFIFQLIMVGISTILSNMYIAFVDTAGIGVVANMFPNFGLIVAYMPNILLVVSAVIAIVMYGKASGGQQYAY